MEIICGFGPIQSFDMQTFDFGFFVVAHQPFSDPFIFGIVNRRVQNTVNCGGGHAARS